MPIVVAETVEKRIARIAINVPEKRNAIGPDVRDQLIAFLSEYLQSDKFDAIVLGSEAGNFCSGGDINTMRNVDLKSGLQRMQDNHKLVNLLACAQKPLVAAVEGYAMGAGAGIALLCDSIVLAEGGSFGFPFFSVGLTPDYGIIYTLPRRVGSAKARQFLLRRQIIDSAQALGVGLVDEIAVDGGAEERAIEIAIEMADAPQTAFSLTKRHLMMEPQNLATALELECMSQSLAFSSSEFTEGLDAFFEKRRPNFHCKTEKND
ncbi:MAG: enoyl-CoA hydratase [Rhodospirillaceae bacterium]|nr:enoyl-CoA hydratase [Rhodospirillaceae bacterium]|tara:strand:- start:47 stop:835 length:789 start_codon:yes stop_codon:yes gene_type:complete